MLYTGFTCLITVIITVDQHCVLDLVSCERSGLLLTGGGSFFSTGGSSLLSTGGGSLLTTGGGSLLSTGGGSLLSKGGGSLLSISGRVNVLCLGDVMSLDTELRLCLAGIGGGVPSGKSASTVMTGLWGVSKCLSGFSTSDFLEVLAGRGGGEGERSFPSEVTPFISSE